MLGELLREPAARRTYIAAKVGVFALAALVTWPLSRAVGPRAWLGLAVFGVILAVMTVLVLAAARADRARTGDTVPSEDGEDDHTEPPPDPDEPVEIPIEDALDLHPFPPRDIPDVVASYLEEAAAKGLDEVRVIHGRGIGVQRERVRSLLSKHPLVLEYSDATPDRGGWGATLVRLKPSK
jgi:hypothetical protein